MKSLHAVVGALVMAVIPAFAAAELSEIASEAELSSVTGQEGIAVELTIRLNADALGNKLPFCTATPSQCQLGINYANRNDSGGEWLVLKDYYGVLSIPTLNLSGAYTPSASTPYRDMTRFQDENGGQLLNDPNNLPALELEYKEPIKLLLHIGGAAIEYGATGYATTDSRSFLGLHIGNVGGQMAEIDIRGKAYVFGF